MDRRVTLGVPTSCLVLFAIVALGMPAPAGAQSVPSGWSARDIGSVGASGSASGSNGSFTLRGAGADIWGSADGFQFAYRSLTGDGEIITRVAGVDYLHAWSKAGVMMRESLSAGARHAFMFASAGKGLAFQRRVWSDGSSSNTGAGGDTTGLDIVDRYSILSHVRERKAKVLSIVAVTIPGIAVPIACGVAVVVSIPVPIPVAITATVVHV